MNSRLCANQEKLLRVQNLRISYADKQVIRNVAFSLNPGEFTALLGLNGSGKTTLLRALCGLKKADTGSCYVNGQDSMRLDERRRAKLLGYIPQRQSIACPMSVLDVVLMGFRAHMLFFQTPGKKERKIVLETLEKLGLEMLANTNFQHLSEGQKQLVILARTLVQNTPVLMLDEPDSALDFVNRHIVLSAIRDTLRENGKCGLITHHDPNFALQYCDRLLLLSQGTICGEIRRDMQPDQIKNTLSEVLGEIDLLAYKSSYMILKA